MRKIEVNIFALGLSYGKYNILNRQIINTAFLFR
jgi:hypothetical protein